MKEIESENARLAPGAKAAREEAFRTMMAREKMREDNRSAAERALSVDSLLVFGCDGVLPEIVNARVAMFGVLTGTVVEVATGKSDLRTAVLAAARKLGVEQMVAGR